jgi:4-hydroxy-tetrahydrodipicolinate synthase
MMFYGSIVALITPFRKGQIDLTALRKLVDWQIQEGTQGIVVCGSTGEALLLNASERRHVIETVVQQAKGRIPVIAGCGAPSTQEALAMTQEAKEIGCTAALVVTPFYVKPTEEGIYQHFKAINDVGLPIILYNHPGRSVIGMSVDLVVRLAELSNVVGIKDSCDDMTRAVKMRQRIQKPFCLLSGDDPIATAYLAQGGDGVISVSANVAPKQCRQVIQAWIDRDLDTFAVMRDKMLPLHESMVMETNPSPVKYAVSSLGMCDEEVRLPLIPVSEHTRETVRNALKLLG